MGIEVLGLAKTYGNHTLFENLNLTFPYGESRCLMGPSGQGKTTLLHIIMGLVQPDAGRVTGLAGHKLAPVFQEDRLCENLSAGANIRMVCGGIQDSEIQRTLAALGMADSLHQPARELSGGMKRRLAIARALLSGGDILLMDEPFRGLDDETRETVIAHVEQAVRGKTIIWVTHDHREAERMGSTLVSIA